jgi:hypothetical protein
VLWRLTLTLNGRVFLYSIKYFPSKAFTCFATFIYPPISKRNLYSYVHFLGLESWVRFCFVHLFSLTWSLTNSLYELDSSSLWKERPLLPQVLSLLPDPSPGQSSQVRQGRQGSVFSLSWPKPARNLLRLGKISCSFPSVFPALNFTVAPVWLFSPASPLDDWWNS